MRVLFVCMGNICRSPTAEAVMRSLVREAGLQHAIELASAGTGDWHVGRPPDRRAVVAGRARGIEVDGVARQVSPEDFERFDVIVAMDRANLAGLRRLAPDDAARSKLRLLREFDADARGRGEHEVPDPYYGGAADYEHVLDVVGPACRGLLDELRASGGV